MAICRNCGGTASASLLIHEFAKDSLHRQAPSGSNPVIPKQTGHPLQDARYSMQTKSKPSAAGSIWKGKTTPSVNLTPPAAADDPMVLF